MKTTIRRMATLVLGLAFAGVARATDYATSVTISDTGDLPADGIFNVTAADATVTVNVGIADGDSAVAIEKRGVGKLVLNAANTFTGGFTVKGGYVIVNNVDAMGLGVLYSAETAARQVLLNVADATFTNDIEVVNGPYGTAQEGHLAFLKSCTYAGRIYTKAGAAGGFSVGGKGQAATGNASAFAGTVRFTRPIDFSSSVQFALFSYGTLSFDGCVTVPWATFSAAYSANGTIWFNAAGNNLGNGNSVDTYCGYIRCGAENALTNFWWKPYYFCTNPNWLSMDLNGYNQNIKAITFSALGTSDSRSDDPTRQWMQIRSDRLAYVTYTGRGAGVTDYLQHGLWDKAGLILDADPAYTLVQTNRLNSTTADLIISNGTFRLGVRDTFANVPNVYVGAQGRLECLTDQAQAFAACRTLKVDGVFQLPTDGSLPFAQDAVDVVLGPEAELYLPTDSELRVNSLSLVDAQGVVTPQPIERYNAASGCTQIKSGTLFVAPKGDTAATWTGNGATTSIGEAANWSTSPQLPDLKFSSLVATFASGGTSALVDRSFNVSGLVFDAPNDFTLASDGDRVISVGTNGLSVSGGAHAYTVTPRVDASSSMGADWNLSVPSGGTLSLLGGMNQDGKVTQTGGALELASTSRVDNVFKMDASRLKLSGTLTQTGGPVPGHVSGSTAANLFIVDCRDTSRRFVLDGVTVEKQMYAYGSFCNNDFYNNWLIAASNTVNRFLSGIYIYVPQFIVLQDGASIEFAGPLDYDGGLTFGTEDMKDGKKARARVTLSAPMVGPTFQVWGGVTLRIAATGCEIKTTSGDLRPFAMDDGHSTMNSALELAADNAITNMSYVRIGYCGRVDFGATKQYWPALNTTNPERCQPATVMTGLPSSELQVADGMIVQKVEGALSLRACGPAGSFFGITNVVATSCGDVSVDSGTLAFNAGSSWLNGTNVTVQGTGRLEIAQSRTFEKKHAVLHLADDGVMAIPDGVTQTVNALYHEGVKMAPGVYGSAESGAPNQSLAAHFAGKGRLRVRGGMMLVIR